MTSAAESVDRALADLAIHAVDTLSTEMQFAQQSKDRIAAANSILDRLGYGRATRAQADQADRDIRNALEAAFEGAQETKQIEQKKQEEQGEKPKLKPAPKPERTIIVDGQEIALPDGYPSAPKPERDDEA